MACLFIFSPIKADKVGDAPLNQKPLEDSQALTETLSTGRTATSKCKDKGYQRPTRILSVDGRSVWP